MFAPILCLCCPVQVAALRRDDPRPRSPAVCVKDQDTEVKRSVSRVLYAPEEATGTGT
jgi:hypothetical protein